MATCAAAARGGFRSTRPSRSARARNGTSCASIPPSSRSRRECPACAASPPRLPSARRWTSSSGGGRDEKLPQLLRAEILRPAGEPRRVQRWLSQGEQERRDLAPAERQQAALLRLPEHELALLGRNGTLVEDELQRLGGRVHAFAQAREPLRKQILAAHELAAGEALAGCHRDDGDGRPHVSRPELLVVRQAREREPDGMRHRIGRIRMDAREAFRGEKLPEASEKLPLVEHGGAALYVSARG